MKLSLRGGYALRALLVLGKNYGDGVIQIQSIAAQQNIPRSFLEQILNDLKGGGFVESRRGIAGGYRLARPPEMIPLSQVIRHIEGALAPVNCASQNFYKACNCPNVQHCAIRSVMKEVRDAMVTILDKVTVAELCSRERDLQANPYTTDYVI
jgi:Rrf2 family protein